MSWPHSSLSPRFQVDKIARCSNQIIQVNLIRLRNIIIMMSHVKLTRFTRCNNIYHMSSWSDYKMQSYCQVDQTIRCNHVDHITSCNKATCHQIPICNNIDVKLTRLRCILQEHTVARCALYWLYVQYHKTWHSKLPPWNCWSSHS